METVTWKLMKQQQRVVWTTAEKYIQNKGHNKEKKTTLGVQKRTKFENINGGKANCIKCRIGLSLNIKRKGSIDGKYLKTVTTFSLGNLFANFVNLCQSRYYLKCLFRQRNYNFRA
jgi:hypothetical protein